MSIKPLILLILLAVIPMAAIAWLGVRVSGSEAARVEQAYREVLQQRLDEENQRLQRYFEDVRRELNGLADKHGTAAAPLRELVRTHPLVRQAIVLDAEGYVVHPSPSQPQSNSELAFLTEVEQLLDDRDISRLAFPDNASKARSASQSSSGSKRSNNSPLAQNANSQNAISRNYSTKGNTVSSGEESGEGWYAWYFGRGVHLMYWRRIGDDRILVVALARARWMSDLLSRLPETDALDDANATGARSRGRSTEATRWRISLMDAANQTIYMWGRLSEEQSNVPLAEAVVVEPLNAWRLKYFVDKENYRVSQVPVFTGLASVGAALLGLAVFLYREYSRGMREARQRVNFVNQVSHELKTPLTNIRMYADLLEMDLDRLDDETVEKPRTRLDVIISESRRLSRLITNVLTFARADRKQLRANLASASVDDVIERVMDRFRPSLEANEFQTELRLNAPTPVMIDADMVEQIVGNLVSNVERYAAEGRWIGITSSETEQHITVCVRDRGSGVPANLRHKIFEPFYRVSNRLSDANGTGIGLSISRQLARLHGGDLTLEPSDSGTEFRLLLDRNSQSEPHSKSRTKALPHNHSKAEPKQ